MRTWLAVHMTRAWRWRIERRPFTLWLAGRLDRQAVHNELDL